MKRIVKDGEPAEFTDWKERDRMAHRPRWRRVPAPIKEVVHHSLMSEQGYLCCYCESRISIDDSHVEHFRPRRCKERQLDYENLHCSCQRELDAGEPRHCGHRKGSWFDDNLLISPLDEQCDNRFRFTGNGEIFPGCKHDRAASVTIQRLGLDLRKLCAMRAAVVDALCDLPSGEVRRLLDEGDGRRFIEFHTTIEQVLAA